jgi:uncharacterized RDD family membrane protein YckC
MANRPRATATRNPFPGLRPFRTDEEHLFFGRENQVDRMIDKLAAHRFLAVVGTSGSGKSSLVNCGLRPALHRGNMVSAGAEWRMAQCRPGSDPIGQLARALAAPGVLFDQPMTGALSAEALVDATLRRGSLGLVDMVEQADLPSGTQLLLVVDQFEELFRFRALAQTAKDAFGPAEDTIAFVRLLLEAHAPCEVPIHVVLTMRSDFLGDCAQFQGLPEAINEGQYLVPRLTREEIRAAITGPVGVGGGEISPVLVTRLLNDVGDNPDQLSILQHALNRTWAHWENEGPSRGPLDLPHYEASGGMAHALDRHAEEAYAELVGAEQQRLGERVFKALTDKGTDPRGIRRPTRLSTLGDITGATPQELHTVIDVFRKSSRSFLMPPLPEPLTPDSVIDISHESLMRVWERLNRWADEEAQSTRTYRRLSETAALYDAGRTNLWRDPDLRLALDWRRHNRPTKAWAEQHQGGFDRAMAFLDRSRDAREAERIEAHIERRWLERWSYLPIAIVAILFIVLQDYIALYNGIFSVIPFLATEMGGEALRDRLFAATWVAPLLAGTPAAVIYMVLAPNAKALFRRKVLADIHREARAGAEWNEEGEAAATAPDVPAVDVHATVYAAFGRRAAAEVVDWVVCLVAATIVSYPLGLALFLTYGEDDAILPTILLVWIVVFWLYHSRTWTSKHQATPGMRLVGIFVTDMLGRRLGWQRASGRHFARFLSYYTLGFGFLIQPWSDKGQTLHDRLSGTVVLVRPSATTAP